MRHTGRDSSQPNANTVDTDGTDPPRPELASFVDALRALRADAGQPSFRKMAQTAHYSHTALSSVLSGARLPSMELTLAFVKACGGNHDEWRARWQHTRERLHPTRPDPARRRAIRRRVVQAGMVAVAGAALTVALTAALGHGNPPSGPADPAACNPIPATDPRVDPYIDRLRTITEPICASKGPRVALRASGTSRVIGQRVSYYVQRNPDGYVQSQLSGPTTAGHVEWSVYWQENPPDNPAHPGCSWYQEQVNDVGVGLSWRTTGWLCPSIEPAGVAASSRQPPDAAACNPVAATDPRVNTYLERLRSIAEPVCTAMPARSRVPSRIAGGQTTGTTQVGGEQASYIVQRYGDGYVRLQLVGPTPGGAARPTWLVSWKAAVSDDPDHAGCFSYQEQVDVTGEPHWQVNGWLCGSG